jgi:hypothetical protein
MGYALIRTWRTRLVPTLFVIQAGLGFMALRMEHRHGWVAVLFLAAGLNLLGWLYTLRVARAITDTPTSRVASAAQGYVELEGSAQSHQGMGLLTPHSQLPCLWYRYRVERREGDKWRHVDSAESEAPFDLEDGSGRCTLEPAGAHVETTHVEVRREGNLRHTEAVLLVGDRLHALAEFRSRRAEDLALNARLDEGELLAGWKEDQETLHRRFDLDGDGAISPKEWALARLAARREIARRHRELRAQAPRHFLGRPGDGRPFLISNHAPEGLGRRYTWLARLCLALLLACLTGATVLLKSAS